MNKAEDWNYHAATAAKIGSVHGQRRRPLDGWLISVAAMLRFENGFWSFDDAYHLHHKQLKQNVR